MIETTKSNLNTKLKKCLRDGYIVNTNKAFDFIGDHVGHVYFILVAIATICYGVFMFAQGIAYDTDKD